MDELVKVISSLKRAFIVFGFIAIIISIIYIQGTIVRVFLLSFTSIIIAVFLKWLADILMRYIHLRYSLALLIVITVLMGLFVLLLMIAGPSFATQLEHLSSLIVKAAYVIKEKLEQYDWGRKLISEVTRPGTYFSVGASFIGNIPAMIGKIFDVLGDLIFMILMGIFLALEPKLYTENIIRLFYPSKRDQIRELLYAISLSMRNWLLARFYAMAIVGVFTIIGLEIAGVPLPVLLGIIAGLATFVPFIGAILSAIPAILVGFTVSPVMPLWVIVIFLIVHLIEDIITPFIQQQIAFLPPALLISSQILFTIIGGTLGLLMSAPITLVVILAIQVLYLKGYLKEEFTLLGLKKEKNTANKIISAKK